MATCNSTSLSLFVPAPHPWRMGLSMIQVKSRQVFLPSDQGKEVVKTSHSMRHCLGTGMGESLGSRHNQGKLCRPVPNDSGRMSWNVQAFLEGFVAYVSGPSCPVADGTTESVFLWHSYKEEKKHVGDNFSRRLTPNRLIPKISF